jgi:hypothetical protein
MTIQWKVTYSDSCASGTSAPLNLTFDGNDLLHDSEEIRDITVYFIGDDTTPFTIHIDAGASPAPPHVDRYNYTTCTEVATSTAGCVWSRPAANQLDVVFTGPDMDTAVEWIHGGKAPPVPLNVKIKRKDSMNSGACSGWTFP